MKRKLSFLMIVMLAVMASGSIEELSSDERVTAEMSSSETMFAGEPRSVVAPGAKMEKLAGGFGFAEGPAVDSKGAIYFIDIRPNRIHKWSIEGKLSTFLEIQGGANGLYFGKNGSLLACAWLSGQVVSIDQNGEITVLAEEYSGMPFNSPNDLWVDPGGGIYFSDPHNNPDRDGKYVYYITPDREKVLWMTDVNYKPNGLIGTPDGKLLYVINYHSNKTYVHTINADGTLSGKKFFAPDGYDGMTLDVEGNVYLTGCAISVYDSAGNKVETIEVPERPTNLCFGGRDKQTLFITTPTSLYSIRMRVKGL